MEHLLQFGISIDEDAIIKQVTNSASNRLMKSMQSALDNFTRHSWNDESHLEQLFRDEARQLVDEHKDEIIEKATDKLAKNMMNQKVVKAAIAKVVEEFSEKN